MNFEENICIDSFKFATNAPIDCRYVVEDIEDIGDDKIFYDGCITYIKNIDTYIMHNNGKIQPLIMRHKIANLVPMLSELKYKNNPFGSSTEPFVTEDNITTEYLFTDYTTSSNASSYDNRLRIPYFDISKDYKSSYYENISSNANTVFNKYMRGHDCIMDFEHNIFVSKTCEAVYFDGNYTVLKNVVFFSFGRLFNPNTSIDAKVDPVKELSDDNFRLVKLLSDNVSALAEAVERIGTKVLTETADQETLNIIHSLKSSITDGLEREIGSVRYKIQNRINTRNTYTSYNEQSKLKPVPAPKEYEHLEEQDSINVNVIQHL